MRNSSLIPIYSAQHVKPAYLFFCGKKTSFVYSFLIIVLFFFNLGDADCIVLYNTSHTIHAYYFIMYIADSIVYGVSGLRKTVKFIRVQWRESSGRTDQAKKYHGGGDANGIELLKPTPSPPHSQRYSADMQHNDPKSGANVILPNPPTETIIKMTQHRFICRHTEMYCCRLMCHECKFISRCIFRNHLFYLLSYGRYSNSIKFVLTQSTYYISIES